LDREDAHPASPGTLGYRDFGHTVYRQGRKPDHRFEIEMGSIESAASRVIERLATQRAPLLAEDREVLAWFFALQWTRHRWVLSSVRSRVLATTKTSDATSEELASVGLIAALAPLLSAWAMRDDPSARPKEKWNAISSMLGGMDWELQRYSGRALVLGDNVVCLSGVAEGETATVPALWTEHGVGVGFENCKRVTAALAPNLGVLLSRGGHVPRIDAARFNRYTIYNSREWIAAGPDWPTEKPRLYRSAIEQLGLQRMLRPALGDSD
jgi:hypothetical protein